MGEDSSLLRGFPTTPNQDECIWNSTHVVEEKSYCTLELWHMKGTANHASRFQQSFLPAGGHEHRFRQHYML